ncbi:amidohydrolase family protein [Legionella spiritensis]|uniref:amidohydrolase family protein n=1 Tax=Legionella spiritensis TaxID=452 RepID=UPI000F6CF2C3|nr:amidohydrolase family protein [Legionella spiritensis]VEG89758.1 (2-pyrone-4,6-)dicarboxylic acid hydrolase [Legionella spiritensis]
MLKLFDAHFHIIDYQFPLVPNQSYLPPEFTVTDYRRRTSSLNIKGGVIVSGSFQAFDQSYLLAAMHALGPGFVGVSQLPSSVSDEEILRLDKVGVRAIRFNIKRGGSEQIEHLQTMAHRVYELVGWHTELYIDSGALGELRHILVGLPAVSIDHLGLSKQGWRDLLALVEHGVRVKASGFGRVDFDVRNALKDIAAINPSALMFGTDLPSTRAPDPFTDQDITLVRDALDEDLADKALFHNAMAFYRMNASQVP